MHVKAPQKRDGGVQAWREVMEGAQATTEVGPDDSRFLRALINESRAVAMISNTEQFALVEVKD